MNSQVSFSDMPASTATDPAKQLALFALPEAPAPAAKAVTVLAGQSSFFGPAMEGSTPQVRAGLGF